jgi:hypothetical protein
LHHPLSLWRGFPVDLLWRWILHQYRAIAGLQLKRLDACTRRDGYD